MSDCVYVNLDRLPDRAAFAEAQLVHGGVTNPRRASAIDASAAPNGVITDRYKPHRGGPYWEIKPSAVACFESHRVIWEAFLASSNETISVFEDDMLVSETAGAVIKRLSANAEAFEFVKLDGAPQQVRFGAAEVVDGLELRPFRQVAVSSAGYLLTRRGAEVLLEVAETYCDHLDDFLTREHAGFRAFQLFPAVSIQAMFVELSGHPDVPASAAGSERTGGTSHTAGLSKGPWHYRLAKEWSRVRMKATRSLGGDRTLLAQGGAICQVPLAGDLPAYRRGA